MPPAALSNERRSRLTRVLSYVLRHAGPQLGLSADNGWFVFSHVLEELRKRPHWTTVSEAELLDVILDPVFGSRRFELTDGRIRALYGHSSPACSFGEAPAPPALLFHATRSLYLPAIHAHGLLPGKRRNVHLTSSLEYAHSLIATLETECSASVLIGVDTDLARLSGIGFFQAAPDIWTSPALPPDCLMLLHLNTDTGFRKCSLDDLPRSSDDIPPDALDALFAP